MSVHGTELRTWGGDVPGSPWAPLQPGFDSRQPRVRTRCGSEAGGWSRAGAATRRPRPVASSSLPLPHHFLLQSRRPESLPASRGFPTGYSRRSRCLSIWDPRPFGVVVTCPGLSVCLHTGYVTSALCTGRAPSSREAGKGKPATHAGVCTRSLQPWPRCPARPRLPMHPPFWPRFLPCPPSQGQSQQRLGQEVGSLSALDHDARAAKGAGEGPPRRGPAGDAEARVAVGGPAEADAEAAFQDSLCGS